MNPTTPGNSDPPPVPSPPSLRFGTLAAGAFVMGVLVLGILLPIDLNLNWLPTHSDEVIDLSVPSAEEFQPLDGQPNTLAVALREDGAIVLDEREIDKEDLLGLLLELSETFPDQAIILRVATEVDFQAVIDALLLIKEAGIWNVTLATAQSESE